MVVAVPLILAGCAERAPLASDFVPDYLGGEAQLLAEDLVRVRASMTKAQRSEDVTAYADCVLSAFMLERGYNYARFLRTNSAQEGGVSSVDAVYSITSSLPEGIRVIDAKALAADCAQKRIPNV
jgi:hypothetical protein